MELTPVPRTDPGRTRRPLVYGVLALVLVALGVVVWQGLSSASLYFYNADEAVEQRSDLGDKRFRLQGAVVPGTVERTDDGVVFTVSHDGVEVDVAHRGDPPELFQPGIPVVLEGRWSGTGPQFDSDRILVKHSEEYEADHPDRLQDADEGGAADRVDAAP